MTASDDDCLDVVGNLRKYWKGWSLLLRIMVMEGAITRLLGVFFKVVVQAVMNYGGGGVGDDPPHMPGPGWVPTQSRAIYYG